MIIPLKFSRQNSPERWEFDPIWKRIKLNYGKSQAGVRATDGHVPIYGTGGLIEYAQQYLSKGDSILIGCKGTLDNPLYIDHPFWAVDTTYYTSDFHGSTKWLYYIVQTLGLASLNEATGVPSLARETFYKLEIPFPPKPEQSLIAEVLSTIDQAIAHTEALITKYQRIKTGLMQDLLTRGIDEHGQLRNPKTHKFKPSPLGMIPEEWECKPAKDLCSDICVGIVIRPSQYYCDSGVPALRSANIREDGISRDELVFISEQSNQLLSKSIIREGYVLSVRTGYPGTSAVVPKDLDGANCIDLIISKPRAKLLSKYLATWINSPLGRNQVLKGQGGLAQQHFNVSEMENLLVLRPELNEQQRIIELITTQDKLLRLESLYLEKLQAQKKGLMQDLLTGKVSVEALLAQ